MLKSEGFENVWVELKGGVGTRHESENSNNREDIDVVSRPPDLMCSYLLGEFHLPSFEGREGSGLQELLHSSQ
ncbi:unnamed protein product [Rhizophagus irregularis]|nr:unnamed protein product [Rhizophagus irregularis]